MSAGIICLKCGHAKSQHFFMLGQQNATGKRFNDLAYNFFKNSNISLIWSQMDRLQTPPIVTSHFIYLRLIGDRRLLRVNLVKFKLIELRRLKVVLKK
jgi:hypothetical protein